MAGVTPSVFGSLRGLTTVGPRAVAAAALSSRVAAGLGCTHHSAGAARRPRARDELETGRRQRGLAGWARGFSSEVGARESAPAPPSFAFAFDIDGVLLHVSKPIPGASDVLRFLNAHNIPFILLTNGGGKHETERVRDLSERLGVELSTSNFVQSHTPFREFLDGPSNLRDKTVLVTGSDYEKCRSIFHEYGFKNVITPADIFAADPTIFPFQPVNSYNMASRPLPKPLFNETRTPLAAEPTGKLKIDAIFVLNDPRDWALDIQIITDLLLSQQGYVGTYSAKNGNDALPNCGWQQDGQPALYFSNADLFWSAGYHQPRLGQGAFQAALAGLWRRLTGGHELARTSIGKPFADTYRFAERVLRRYRHDELSRLGLGPHEPPGAALRAVYMVGDNPESDIAGANGHKSEDGTEWVSVLVKTGVWSPSRGRRLEGEFKPRAVVDDVMGAVKWALQREGWSHGDGSKMLK